MPQRVLKAAVAAGLALTAGATAAPAQTFHACYVPEVGALYVVKLPGLPGECLAGSHVEITWAEGGTEIDDGAITTAKLANAAVTAAKLANSAVTTAKLGDVSVTTAKLADAAVTAAKLADGAVTAAKLGDDVPAGVSDHGQLEGLGNDDHPQYLLAEGVRAATDGFAVTGTLDSGSIPVEGGGVRLMWYPGKAALRAGRVGGTQWDAANVGDFSVAMGSSTNASGEASTAMGSSTTASGMVATATGLNAAASGPVSTAMGQGTTASGIASTAMGVETTASAWGSTAMGSGTIGSGQFSVAMGLTTRASGTLSTAMGANTTASGFASTAMGSNTTAQAHASLVIGRYNVIAGSQSSWLNNDPLFVAGNGTGTGSRSNALTLRKNGNLTIAGRFQFGNMPVQTSTNLCVVTVQGVGFEPASCSSSIRYKDGIGDLDPAAAAALVERLRPVTFRWTASELEDLGLIAEEVAELDPRLVTYDADGRIEGVKYNHLSALLAAAIQEQHAQMRSLRDEIERLEARNDALSEQVRHARAEHAELLDDVAAFEDRVASLETALVGAARCAAPR